MDARRYNVTSTASEVLPDIGTGSALVRNAGSTDCYLGGSGVIAAAGFLLAAGDVVSVADVKGSTYAITAAGTTTIHVLWGSG